MPPSRIYLLPEVLPEPVSAGPMLVPLDEVPVPEVLVSDDDDAPVLGVLMSDDEVPAPVVPAVPEEALPPAAPLVSDEPEAPELLASVPGFICSSEVRPAASVPEPAGSVTVAPVVPEEEVEPLAPLEASLAPDDEPLAPDAPLAESLEPEAPLDVDALPVSELVAPEPGFICSLDARPAASDDPAPPPADCESAAADVPAKTTRVSA